MSSHVSPRFLNLIFMKHKFNTEIPFCFSIPIQNHPIEVSQTTLKVHIADVLRTPSLMETATGLLFPLENQLLNCSAQLPILSLHHNSRSGTFWFLRVACADHGRYLYHVCSINKEILQYQTSP